MNIQEALVALFQRNPYATDEEIRDTALEVCPKSVYAQRYKDRAAKDRRRYNTADFRCQDGVIPAVKAVNPLRHPEIASQMTFKLED